MGHPGAGIAAPPPYPYKNVAYAVAHLVYALNDHTRAGRDEE
jgi:hypothetical protein